MDIQVFGTNKSQATKKALRFFKERRVAVHFVDLKKQEISVGELSRFVQAFGVGSLVDSSSRSYADAGLEYMKVPEDEMLDKIIDDPTLMQQPLVRSLNKNVNKNIDTTLAIGWQEDTWRTWFDAFKKQ